MSRPGVTDDKKFLNVRVSARVIAKAKAAASLHMPPLKLNEYVEVMLDVPLLEASPAKKGRRYEPAPIANSRRAH